MVYMTGFLIPSRLGFLKPICLLRLYFLLFDCSFLGGRYRDGILFH